MLTFDTAKFRQFLGQGTAYEGAEYQAYISGAESVLDAIEEQQEVEQMAQWDDKGYCTSCGKRCIGNQYEEWRTPYCPYCGKKMKERRRV